MSEPIAQRMLVGLREANEMERKLRTLRSRGIARPLLATLIAANDVDLVRALHRLTYTPPPRKGFSRRWWRLRTAFGATDPHETRRAEVAAMIATLNGGSA